MFRCSRSDGGGEDATIGPALATSNAVEKQDSVSCRKKKPAARLSIDTQHQYLVWRRKKSPS
jgi:hypothetical protein